jgi:hypothetical protein
VPIIRPSSAEKPIVVATLSSPCIAQRLAPLPRCATMVRPRARSPYAFGRARQPCIRTTGRESIAPDAAIRERVRQRQHPLHWRKRAVKRRVEARDLRQVGHVGEQDLDRLQRERLVQRRQRDVALQIREDIVVDADGCGVLVAAVHDPMHDCHRRSSAGLRDDGCAHVPQRGVVGLLDIECERCRWRSRLHELRAIAADAFDLARPDGLARQRRHRGVEQRELDARRPAIEHQDRLARRPERTRCARAPALLLGRGCFAVLVQVHAGFPAMYLSHAARCWRAIAAWTRALAIEFILDSCRATWRRSR